MLFKRKRPVQNDAFPKPSWVQIEAESEGLPDLIVVNQALDAFAPRAALAWHLSIIVDMVELAVAGLPSQEEQKTLAVFRAELESILDEGNNVTLLASITWNGTRQYLYRARDPERAHGALQRLIAGGKTRRQFDYRMEHDPEWTRAEAYLQHGRKPS